MGKREEYEENSNGDVKEYTGAGLAEAVFDLLGEMGDIEGHLHEWPTYLLSSVCARSERTPGLLECKWDHLSNTTNKYTTRVLQVWANKGESLPYQRDLAVLNVLVGLSTTRAGEVEVDVYRHRFSYTKIVEKLQVIDSGYSHKSVSDSIRRLAQVRIGFGIRIDTENYGTQSEERTVEIPLWINSCSRGGHFEVIWHTEIYRTLIKPYSSGERS